MHRREHSAACKNGNRISIFDTELSHGRGARETSFPMLHKGFSIPSRQVVRISPPDSRFRFQSRREITHRVFHFVFVSLTPALRFLLRISHNHKGGVSRRVSACDTSVHAAITRVSCNEKERRKEERGVKRIKGHEEHEKTEQSLRVTYSSLRQ